jgi:hypothetical protein
LKKPALLSPLFCPISILPENKIQRKDKQKGILRNRKPLLQIGDPDTVLSNPKWRNIWRMDRGIFGHQG